MLHFQSLFAQQAQTEKNIDDASIYLDSKTASLDKYTGKSQKIQQRLLKKLKRKETKLFKSLAAKDSVAYLQYIDQGLSYDSIATLSKDTSYQQKPANALKTAFGGQQQALYLGIMQHYKISKKWGGTILLGYNFLWQQQDLRSPILLRCGWSSN